VRENGGQYTHAAIWMIMAWAKLGDRKRTWELLNLINPINHSKTFEKMSIYKVEPYVMSADVYGVAPHIGRGGWSWYTGSASWMYQLILESFLGLKKVGDTLEFKPCIPDEWEFFDIEYQYLDTVYKIKCVQKHGESYQLQLDGVELEQPQLALTNDKADHSVIFH
jgi:cellobiose phosphorylase